MACPDSSWVGGLLGLITILALATGIVMIWSYDKGEKPHRIGWSIIKVSASALFLSILMVWLSYGLLFYSLKKMEKVSTV
jgi:drug/metabolite transporter (DMT)-like permease